MRLNAWLFIVLGLTVASSILTAADIVWPPLSPTATSAATQPIPPVVSAYFDKMEKSAAAETKDIRELFGNDFSPQFERLYWKPYTGENTDQTQGWLVDCSFGSFIRTRAESLAVIDLKGDVIGDRQEVFSSDAVAFWVDEKHLAVAIENATPPLRGPTSVWIWVLEKPAIRIWQCDCPPGEDHETTLHIVGARGNKPPTILAQRLNLDWKSKQRWLEYYQCVYDPKARTFKENGSLSREHFRQLLQEAGTGKNVQVITQHSGSPEDPETELELIERPPTGPGAISRP